MLTVIGSINIDLVVTTERIPKVGETVIGCSFNTYPGGKGANQAVAASKIGLDVAFLGCVGQDSYGEQMVSNLRNNGVLVDAIETIQDKPTGMALISVDSRGQNNIIVIPGANLGVNCEYVDRHVDKISQADYVLSQLEIPLESVILSFKYAKASNRTTILNPAPAQELPDELIRLTDILIPNEHELHLLTGIDTSTDNGILSAAEILFKKGVKQLLVTVGKRGCAWVRADGLSLFPIYDVPVVDTTAAGDSFIGGFISSLMSDNDMEKAIRNGNAVASLSVQKAGAQSSLPDKEGT